MLIVFWILCGFVTSLIFGNKGRNAIGGFLLGALLGPFGILIALVSSKDESQLEKQAVQTGLSRKCPECAEVVKAEARKCRFCGSDLTPTVASAVASRVPGHSPKCGCKRCYGMPPLN